MIWQHREIFKPIQIADELIMDECLPIKDLEGLLNWKPDEVRHVTIPITKRLFKKNCPKTLVCHDMKGGYLDDRFVHGIQKKDCFSFIHWSFVDIFVYFSHYLVTIPPCSWISAAHRNGSKILGTFITEWEQGSVFCEQFLSSTDTVNKLCSQLVNIALVHDMDGWLINIENKIKPHEICHLVEFVSSLTSKMHAAKTDSLVIWYDSVTEDGELKWQNALNENNKKFFIASDGIFLNYNWKDDHLEKSVLEAGSRMVDVYVGVDVFGRGCLGGGGFCTNIAVQKARDFGLSVAIFAPGWVYECLELNNYLENQYKFWDLLSELCPVRAYSSLPFSTSFCPGFGKKMYRKGKVISDKPWYNLALQEPQSSYFDYGSVTVSTNNAFSGGGCLQLTAVSSNANEQHLFRIFSTAFTIEETCLIRYTFMPDLPSDTEFALVLSMSSFQGNYYLHLVGEKQDADVGSSLHVEPETQPTVVLCPEKLDGVSKVGESTEKFDLWKNRIYLLRLPEYKNHVIEKVEARISYKCSINTSVSVLLGAFEVKFVKHKTVFRCSQFQKNVTSNGVSVKCTLEWAKPNYAHFCDIYYQLGGSDKIYINTTTQDYLNVDLTFNPPESSNLLFLLYPQGSSAQLPNEEVLKIKL